MVAAVGGLIAIVARSHFVAAAVALVCDCVGFVLSVVERTLKG